MKIPKIVVGPKVILKLKSHKTLARLDYFKINMHMIALKITEHCT